MRIRTTPKFVLAVAALAITAAAASAQDTSKAKARSTKRIAITKESKGEVVPARVDTVTITRTDTVRVIDTVRVNGRIDTVTRTMTRVDTAGTGGTGPAAGWTPGTQILWRYRQNAGRRMGSSGAGLASSLGGSGSAAC